MNHFFTVLHGNGLTLSLIAALAIGCLLAMYFFLNQGTKLSARIQAIRERRDELHGEMTKTKRRKRPEASVTFIRAVATKLKLVQKSQVSKSEALLVEAGYRSKDAIFVLAFFNLVMPIVLGVAGLIIMKLNSHVSPRWQIFNYAWPVFGAYVGLKLPGIIVSYARKKRNIRIQRSLSDVLDLMTICAEAGLSLAAMIVRVARELEMTYPEMAEELSFTSIEMGFLPDRNQALTNLSKRCTLPEVRGIVSVLIQTEKYGTPIAQALRVLAAEFRQTRMLRAEQKAAKLPALMTVPMIVFILPTLFIVILSPAIVKLMDTIK